MKGVQHWVEAEFNSALAVATRYTVEYPPGITGLSMQSTAGGVQHVMKMKETEMSILVTLSLDCVLKFYFGYSGIFYIFQRCI